MKIKMQIAILLTFVISNICNAQFFDSFDKKEIEGWFFFTGDGAATMNFIQKDGYATIFIDATRDKYNVYWTTIKRDVSDFLDLQKMKDTSFQLRVEAKVRVHNAPRRLNMMVNTQRTTNFHIDLMEFDIPDTVNWHIISMTTKRFDAVPGDTVYVQLSVTDYGLDKYFVDIDYYRTDIVNVNIAGPDKGEFVPYHPPVPELSTFSNHLDVARDCLINPTFPDVNFNDWHIKESGSIVPVLTINENQWAILGWDFGKYKSKKVDGAGLLELTTQSVSKGGDFIDTYGEDYGMEFGKIRVVEIIGGDADWNQKKVTYENFIKGHNLSEVFNSQMIYDFEVSDSSGNKNYITISKPVLQRLLDGKTKGLLICPLGAINASFYSSEHKPNCPRLHFNLKK